MTIKKLTTLLVLSALTVLTVTACGGDHQAEQQCANRQAEYESRYIYETGTTDGMDTGKYTFVSGQCQESQGVEG